MCCRVRFPYACDMEAFVFWKPLVFEFLLGPSARCAAAANVVFGDVDLFGSKILNIFYNYTFIIIEILVPGFHSVRRMLQIPL
jgi:hypothetical protein